MPVVLGCNISGKKRSAVVLAALRCGCRYAEAAPERFGATLEALLRGDGTAAPVDAPFGEELLVLAQLSEGQLDALLAQLRQQRCSIALKAVLTPTNAGWTVQALYEELCRERAAFDAGRRAQE